MDVLLVGSGNQLPAGVEDCLSAGDWNVHSVGDFQTAAESASHNRFDAVVLGAIDEQSEARSTFLRFVDSQRIAAVVVGGEASDINIGAGSLVDVAGADVTKEEISRRLATLTRFHLHVRRIEQELENMQRLGKRLHQHFREIDDEMRLASRLQQSFLPRDTTQFETLNFAFLYRPATWVSGDIFDIMRLDEHHVGLYIADAVGHGMAAGLLTMFIKRSLVTKEVDGQSYRLLDPGESLKLLNDTLEAQALPNCQFVTMLYCVINTETLKMKYARGGHPYPLLTHKDGRTTQLKSPGALMGIFSSVECPTYEVQLEPGDKVVLYTDGIEGFFDHIPLNPESGYSGHLAILDSLGRLSASDLIAKLNDRLDHERGSLLPDDDITVVAMEVAR